MFLQFLQIDSHFCKLSLFYRNFFDRNIKFGKFSKMCYPLLNIILFDSFAISNWDIFISYVLIL